MKVEFHYQSEKYAVFDCIDNYEKFPVKLPGETGILQIQYAVPLLDMHGYWIPENRTPSAKIDWIIKSQSSGARYFPFLALFNSKQENRLSTGLTNLIDDSQCFAKMNQEDCTYDITIRVALDENSKDFDLIIDRRPLQWQEALADWRGNLGIVLPEFPEAAWEPVYCTWYAMHAALTQDLVEANAQVASELGFRTLIVDDGWCYDDIKRISPETISAWYEKIGDWELSTQKFPDFKSHLERIHDLGMKYLLWVAPFMVGAKSAIRQTIPGGAKCLGAYHVFDPGNREASELMINKMIQLFSEHNLDGLKIDFLDCIPSSPEDSHGQAITAFIENLSAEIRDIKPDALIEFRQNYATPGMLPYGTQFRAGDVPFDFLDNFQRLAQIRIGLGDGIPIHADPAYWHPQELPVNISRHMIASLAGVPMVSMDMVSLSETERQIISFWLKFYHEHLNTFKYAKWQVSYHQTNVSWISASFENQTMLILNDDARLEEALTKCQKQVFILNLSPSELELPNVTAFNCLGLSVQPGIIPLGGLGVIT